MSELFVEQPSTVIPGSTSLTASYYGEHEIPDISHFAWRLPPCSNGRRQCHVYDAPRNMLGGLAVGHGRSPKGSIPAGGWHDGFYRNDPAPGNGDTRRRTDGDGARRRGSEGVRRGASRSRRRDPGGRGGAGAEASFGGLPRFLGVEEGTGISCSPIKDCLDVLSEGYLIVVV